MQSITLPTIEDAVFLYHWLWDRGFDVVIQRCTVSYQPQEKSDAQ